MKNGKKHRSLESGRKMEARKTETVMGRLREGRLGKSGRKMENDSKRWRELESFDREHSERKVRKEKRKKDDKRKPWPTSA